jgi:cation diffusion facilitator CzcD-associated flavoprotein CzcO
VKDKRVAVIGSGSSGIQVLATLQKEAKQIYHWIRSPTWITGPIPLYAFFFPSSLFQVPSRRNLPALEV